MKEDIEAAVEPDALKDCVFVASLIRVLTDAFGSAKDLYHRLKQQSNCDDDDTTAEKDKPATYQDGRDSHSNTLDSLGRHVRWSLDQRARHDSDREDELVCTASASVQTTYDRAYRKVGEPYARGDDPARIQLQSQIVKLQQVLISIHQDLGLSNYLTVASSHSQLTHLVQTVRTTRAATTQALHLLHERLLADPPPQNPTRLPSIPGQLPTPLFEPHHRHRISISTPSFPPLPVSLPPKPAPFCPYALLLQTNPYLPLSPSFSPHGSLRCPHCHTAIRVRPNKAWEIVLLTDDNADTDTSCCAPRARRRTFRVRNAFVVKCHCVGGGFRCVLCGRGCGDVGGLVEHLWREHGRGELEGDGDIVCG